MKRDALAKDLPNMTPTNKETKRCEGECVHCTGRIPGNRHNDPAWEEIYCEHYERFIGWGRGEHGEAPTWCHLSYEETQVKAEEVEET